MLLVIMRPDVTNVDNLDSEELSQVIDDMIDDLNQDTIFNPSVSHGEYTIDESLSKTISFESDNVEINSVTDKIHDGSSSLDLLNDEKNVDHKKVNRFLSKLLSVTVVVKKLQDSTIAEYEKNLENNTFITTCKTQSPSLVTQYDSTKRVGTRDLSSRYCFKCKTSKAHHMNKSIKLPQRCEHCTSVMAYRCKRCEKIVIHYSSMTLHLLKMCRGSIEAKKEFKSKTMQPPTNLAGTKASTFRYCSNCKISKEHCQNISVTEHEYCKKCTSVMVYLCKRCEKLITSYASVSYHLLKKCSGSVEARKKLESRTHRNGRKLKQGNISRGTRNSTLRYCSNCGTLSDHRNEISITDNQYCRKCNSVMLYRCKRCEKQLLHYPSMTVHLLKQCKGSVEARMRWENLVARKRSSKKKSNDKTKPTAKPPGKKYSTDRYCLKCKISIEHGEGENIKESLCCKNCNSELLYRCKKCEKQILNYPAMTFHLLHKCLGSIEARKKQESLITGFYPVYKPLKHENTLMDSEKVLTKKQSIQHDRRGTVVSRTMKFCKKCEKWESHNSNSRAIQYCKGCGEKMFWQCNGCGKVGSYCVMWVHLKYCARKSQIRINEIETISRPDKLGMRYLTKRYCSDCDFVFNVDPMAPIINSCEKCDADLQWQCVRCNKRTNNYKAMDSHLRVVCNAHRCKHCVRKFNSRNLLILHIQSHHPDVLECLNCEKKFANKWSYKQHVTFCGKKKTIKCKFCSHRTSYRYNIKTHVIKVHNITNLTTDECIDHTYSGKTR